jgi:predicted flap endonuclease-1-like 5' DNA nuclease
MLNAGDPAPAVDTFTAPQASESFEIDSNTEASIETTDTNAPEGIDATPRSTQMEFGQIDQPQPAATTLNDVRPQRNFAKPSRQTRDAVSTASRSTDQNSEASRKAITWNYLLSKLPANFRELVDKVPVWVFFTPIALFIAWVLWPAGDEEDDGVEEARRNLEARAEREREKTERTEEALARAKAARDAAKAATASDVSETTSAGTPTSELVVGSEVVVATEQVETPDAGVVEQTVNAAPARKPDTQPATRTATDAQVGPKGTATSDLPNAKPDASTPELDPLAPLYAVGKDEDSQTGPADKSVISKKLDDLTKLQGIDIVIQQALYNLGYYEYKDLQMADPSDLQFIISSFDRDLPCDGNDWSWQAAFAQRGDWTGLNEYLRIKGVTQAATVTTETGTAATEPAIEPADTVNS